VSETDSFIDEVTEEVRRDRLFSMMRRYGWIGVLVILLIVGGATWNEWRKARAEAEAQAFGDAVLAALESVDRAARADALDAVAAPGRGPAAPPRADLRPLAQGCNLTRSVRRRPCIVPGSRVSLRPKDRAKGRSCVSFQS